MPPMTTVNIWKPRNSPFRITNTITLGPVITPGPFCFLDIGDKHVRHEHL
jgi:hypothetical protein